MNTDTKIKNFYEEEAEYEKSIATTKELVKKVVFLDIDAFSNKLKLVDNENNFSDFIDLFLAVTGRKTNKYYYCKNEEDLKYHQVVQGNVYKMSEIDADLQSKYSEERVLDLEARSIIAKLLFIKTSDLKALFAQNVKQGDGLISTIEEVMILEKDVEYFDNLLLYLSLMMDKTGRLKILVAERDIYAMEEAKKQYEKKTGAEKLFHKLLGTKKSVIEGMADKNKYR